MEQGTVVSNIWSWISGSVLGPGLLVLIPMLYVFYNRKIDEYREILKNSEDRKNLTRELSRRQGIRRYRAKIRRLAMGLRRWFGPPLSAKAFNRCFQIAFVYPILLFVIAWATGGEGIIAGVIFFPPIENWWSRALIALVVLMVGLVFGIYLNKFYQILFWIEKRILLIFDRKKIETTPLITWVAKGVASVVAGAFVVVVVAFVVVAASVVVNSSVVDGAFVVTLVVVTGVVASGSVAVTRARVSALVAAFVAVVVPVVVVGVSDSSVGAVIYLFVFSLFLFVLPLVNASLDWLSWGATRYFLSRVTRVTGGSKAALEITLDLFLDLIVAALCLIALAAALPNVIELANYLFNWLDLGPIRWPEYVFSAINDPFGGGLLIWGMLLSTLFPTLIHLAIGFKALFEALTPADLKALLPADGQDWKDDQSRFRAANHLFYRLFWWVPAGLLSGGMVFGFFYGLYAFFGQFAWTLGAVAFCATSWKHGYCPLF